MTASPDARCVYGKRLTCVSPTGQITRANVGCITYQTTVHTLSFNVFGIFNGASTVIRLSRVGSQASISIPGIELQCANKPGDTGGSDSLGFDFGYYPGGNAQDSEYSDESGYLYDSGGTHQFAPAATEPMEHIVPCEDNGVRTTCVWIIQGNKSGTMNLKFQRFDQAVFACGQNSASPGTLRVHATVIPYLANWLAHPANLNVPWI